MFLHCFLFTFFFLNFLSHSLGLTSIINNFFHIIFNKISGITFTQFILLISPRNTISFQFALHWSISLHLPTFWNHWCIFIVWNTILEFSVLRRLMTNITAFVFSSFQTYASEGILRIGSLLYQIENILGLRRLIFDSLNRLNVIYILIRHHLLLSVRGTTANSSTSFHLNLWLLLIRILSL